MVRIYGVTASSGSGSGTGGANTTANHKTTELFGITSGAGSGVFLTSIILTSDNSGVPSLLNIANFSINTVSISTINILAYQKQYPIVAASWTFEILVTKGVSPALTKLVGISLAKSLSDDALSSASLTVSSNTTYGGISIFCLGVNGYTLNWLATIDTVEA